MFHFRMSSVGCACCLMWNIMKNSFGTDVFYMKLCRTYGARWDGDGIDRAYALSFVMSSLQDFYHCLCTLCLVTVKNQWLYLYRKIV